MAQDLGHVFVGVECSDCGTHVEGVPADSGRTRCGKCGQFGSPADDYCSEHDVNYGRISGRSRCPLCVEERKVQRREQEMHARRSDPNMHNMVDAQANAIDHGRPRGP